MPANDAARPRRIRAPYSARSATFEENFACLTGVVSVGDVVVANWAWTGAPVHPGETPNQADNATAVLTAAATKEPPSIRRRLPTGISTLPQTRPMSRTMFKHRFYRTTLPSESATGVILRARIAIPR
jgi:hypothetical protein